MKYITFLPSQTPISGEVVLPGSKSLTNRALIVASLADGESIIRNASLSDDSMVLIDGLRKLGVQIKICDGIVQIGGICSIFPDFSGTINVGHAGTTMRFLTSFLAAMPGASVSLEGSQRMHQRPIKDLVDALLRLGARIEYLGKHGFPPLKITGTRELLNEVSIDSTTSSQFISSLLMIGPLIAGGLKIRLSGTPVSRPYITLTLDVMRQFGVTVKLLDENTLHILPGSNYHHCDFMVEPDLSGASYFWGLAAISGGRIKVKNLTKNTKQGDIKFLDALKLMGCRIFTGPDGIEVGCMTKLKGIEFNMADLPDVAQTMAVIAATASGRTVLTGLSTLVHKETNRLVALKTELARVGISSEITDDSITVVGRKPVPARIQTYDDHRMAMAFSLLGAVIPELEIEDPDVVNKSFPGFWDKLESIGVSFMERGL